MVPIGVSRASSVKLVVIIYTIQYSQQPLETFMYAGCSVLENGGLGTEQSVFFKSPPEYNKSLIHLKPSKVESDKEPTSGHILS